MRFGRQVNLFKTIHGPYGYRTRGREDRCRLLKNLNLIGPLFLSCPRTILNLPQLSLIRVSCFSPGGTTRRLIMRVTVEFRNCKWNAAFKPSMRNCHTETQIGYMRINGVISPRFNRANLQQKQDEREQEQEHAQH